MIINRVKYCPYCGQLIDTNRSCGNWNCNSYRKEDLMQKIIRYEISRDGLGLLGYFEDGSFYHIHSDELSKLEKWIWNELVMFEQLKKR